MCSPLYLLQCQAGSGRVWHATDCASFFACCRAKQAVIAESDEDMESPKAGRRVHPSPVATKSVCLIDRWLAWSLRCCGDLQTCMPMVMLACHQPALLLGPHHLESCLNHKSGTQLAVWLIVQDLL